MISENPEAWRPSFAVHVDSPNYASSLTLAGGGAGGDASCPSEASESSWASISPQDSQRPPPPAPIPVPSPAINARGLADGLSVVPDDRGGDLESGVRPQRGSRRERGRSLVDGFIVGFKKLPKAVMKTYQSAERRTERGGMSTMHELPISHTVGQLLTPIVDSGSSVRGPKPLTPPVALNHTSRHSHEGEADATQHVLLSPAMGINSPILVEPRPSSDYAKMEPPVPAPPEPSLGHYVSRIHRFIKDVNDLPWVSPRTTVDYIPGQSSRSRDHSQRTRVPGRPSTTLSWYAPPMHQSLDLLSSGPTPMTRLPNSSVTLAYPPDLGTHEAKGQWSGAGSGDGGGPFVQSPSFIHSQGDTVPAPQMGRHVRSVQIYDPPVAVTSQRAGSQYPYPIVRPPPARML